MQIPYDVVVCSGGHRVCTWRTEADYTHDLTKLLGPTLAPTKKTRSWGFWGLSSGSTKKPSAGAGNDGAVSGHSGTVLDDAVALDSASAGASAGAGAGVGAGKATAMLSDSTGPTHDGSVASLLGMGSHKPKRMSSWWSRNAFKSTDDKSGHGDDLGCTTSVAPSLTWEAVLAAREMALRRGFKARSDGKVALVCGQTVDFESLVARFDALATHKDVLNSGGMLMVVQQLLLRLPLHAWARVGVMVTRADQIEQAKMLDFA